MFEALIAAKAFRAGLFFGIFTAKKERPPLAPIEMTATPHRKASA